MDSEENADRTGVYQGRASLTPPADAAEVPAARCVGFVRALVRGHYARADGRCACGHWLSACEVRVLAHAYGIPVDPTLRGRLRDSPAV
jgi:hypothetical protein